MSWKLKIREKEDLIRELYKEIRELRIALRRYEE